MAGFLNFSKSAKEEFVEDTNEEYLSITESDAAKTVSQSDKSVDVKVFVLDDYDSIRDILDEIRSGKTMCLVDIHLLRNKDPEELKRAVDKIKKTADAISGEVVAFHESWIMAAPANVHIHKGRQ